MIMSGKYFALPLIMAGLLCLATSCDPNLVYEKNKTLEEGVWKSNDLAKFNVDLYDTTSLHNFYINVRVTSQYRYANLFLYMKTLYPGGQISIDTVECFLADVDGRWLGKRSGRMIDNRILLMKNLKFPLPGTYSYEFEQAMRDTVLEHIEDFGIRVEKAVE
jgi:gliding motility-associated lipoprotein GldH